ncbi:hypothetical protein ACQP1O_42960 (plasmid) [Nocardia sp. CA-151230]|uniref:hypothetical protein n=1 Tax=Nocardia sp. CA-151230 TaxID=3239982 RepID=UPI003D9504DD
MSDSAGRQSSVCEHCGCHPWTAKMADRYQERAELLKREYERQAAAHAVEAAQWRVKELEHAEAPKGFQRKIAEQSRTIRRLESKLRAAGIPPYADRDNQGDN